MENRSERWIFFIVILAALLLTRVPASAGFLSIDNINLAFALEKFDPRIHQPHPPGYPLFVLLSHLVNFVFQDVKRTFIVISVLVSALSLWTAFALGTRMFSPWAGGAGAFLLLVNPVFWHAGLEGPLRPNLALFSLLTAYCCWRCWTGESRFAIWGAVALGIGGGFRPDIIAFLFPLWLVSLWVGTRSWRVILSAAAVFLAIAAAWTSAIVIAMGGFETFWNTMLNYAIDWSGYSSAAPAPSVISWLRQKSRLFIWNGLGIISWVWAAPFCFMNRGSQRFGRSYVIFSLLWIVPGISLQAITHFSEPEHTLFSVSAFCVIGGYVLSRVPARDAALGAGLIVNLLFFLGFFALPPPKARPGEGTPSLKNAIVVGAFQSSIGHIRKMDEITRDALAEIKTFTPRGRPSVIITTDDFVRQWFMNWRIARYYLPERDIWVLHERATPRRADRIRRAATLETRNSTPLQIPVSHDARLLWVLEPDSPFYGKLSDLVKMQGGRYVTYVDFKPGSPSLVVDGFEIVSIER